MDFDWALQMNESPAGGFDVTVVFLCTFEKAASSVLHSLEPGEQAFHKALEKGIAAVKERRDVSIGEGFCK